MIAPSRVGSFFLSFFCFLRFFFFPSHLHACACLSVCLSVLVAGCGFFFFLQLLHTYIHTCRPLARMQKKKRKKPGKRRFKAGSSSVQNGRHVCMYVL
ncbi:hypothetical protein F5X96DRAFT_642417 [Biscogniauxia mediterranea]|nr:hypothetical protein F5X96DRAFT_642417 [Biscogniauxia mediterranea]